MAEMGYLYTVILYCGVIIGGLYAFLFALYFYQKLEEFGRRLRDRVWRR